MSREPVAGLRVRLSISRAAFADCIGATTRCGSEWCRFFVWMRHDADSVRNEQLSSKSNPIQMST